MKKHLVVAFISCFPILGISSDTVLIKIVTAPYTVREMVKDYRGVIYLNTSNGVFTFDGVNLSPSSIKIQDNDIMVSHEGRITTMQKLNEQGIFIDQGNLQSQEWADYVGSPLKVWVAFSNEGIYWVLKENRYLIGFKIYDEFKIQYPAYSLRGIYNDDESIWVLTYNGVFKDEVKMFESEVDFSNTNFCVVGDSIFFGANFDIKFISKSNNSLNDFLSASQLNSIDEISAIQYFENQLWIGGTKGLMVYKNAQLTEKLMNIYVHNLVVIDDQLLVCTMQGLYVYKNGEFEKIPKTSNITTALKIGNKLLLGSFSGLWEYDLDNLKLVNLFINTKYESVETASLLYDDAGNLWIGTSDGLLVYNLLTQKINVFFEHFEFNRRSALKAGELFYLGGVHGLVNFNPKKIFLSNISIDSPVDNNSLFQNLILIFLGGSLFFVIYYFFMRKKIPSKEFEMEVPEDNKLTFDNIQEYIYNNIDSVNVDDLRNKMGISKHAFYDGFDLNFNKKPKELILDIKKKKAIENLKKSNFRR